ncbi:MAG: NTP transferase domain-containing protein, partial [Deltaproteobacteria bacterium]|nr:NTP transferase domain-containing protein [Deltaproteobacteria bacterium]
METIATIILAAGKGTRMKSSIPKILHPMAGEPMIFYPITTIKDELNANPLVVVVGKEGEKIKVYFEDTPILFAEQPEPLGTAHAVMCG